MNLQLHMQSHVNRIIEKRHIYLILQDTFLALSQHGKKNQTKYIIEKHATKILQGFFFFQGGLF